MNIFETDVKMLQQLWKYLPEAFFLKFWTIVNPNFGFKHLLNESTCTILICRHKNNLMKLIHFVSGYIRELTSMSKMVVKRRTISIPHLWHHTNTWWVGNVTDTPYIILISCENVQSVWKRACKLSTYLSLKYWYMINLFILKS